MKAAASRLIGRGISAKDAAAVADVLKGKIKDGEADTDGCRRALIAKSRPVGSKTHHLFEWRSAHQQQLYLLHRASELIRAVLVIFEDQPGVTMRAFPTIRLVQGPSKVVDMRDAIRDRDLIGMLVHQAKAEALSWAKRYEHLRTRAELSGMFAAADGLLPKT